MRLTGLAAGWGVGRAGMGKQVSGSWTAARALSRCPAHGLLPVLCAVPPSNASHTVGLVKPPCVRHLKAAQHRALAALLVAARAVPSRRGGRPPPSCPTPASPAQANPPPLCPLWPNHNTPCCSQHTASARTWGRRVRPGCLHAGLNVACNTCALLPSRHAGRLPALHLHRPQRRVVPRPRAHHLPGGSPPHPCTHASF